MKKVTIYILLFIIFISNVCAIEIKSRNAIVYNYSDDIIVYSKNENEKVQIASLTKIITAITVLDNTDDLNKEIVVTKNMISNIDGYAKINLKVGDKLTILDLLYALMLPSAADAAQALALTLSENTVDFSVLMNRELDKIGVKNSHFDNPVGIDSENNYSTALDLSIILKYCLNNQIFKKIYESDYYYIKSIDKTIYKTLSTTLKKYNLNLDMVTGAKTGFTYKAGLCLSSTITIDNSDFIFIVLGSDINYPYQIEDTINLYNYVNSNYSHKKILSKNDKIVTLKIKNSKQKEYVVYSNNDVIKYLNNSINLDELKYYYTGITVLNKNIKTGDKIGEYIIKYNEDILYKTDVYLSSNIQYYNYKLVVFIISIILLLLILCKKLKNKKNKKLPLSSFYKRIKRGWLV